MLERLREKYEVILGFVTLIISLSAFKDELAKVAIDLGWTSFSLATYLLYCVYGFSVCLYLYVSESFLRETRLGRSKVLGAILWVAVFLFGFILLSPILILLNVLVYRAFLWASSEGKAAAETVSLVGTILGALASAIASWISSRMYIRQRKRIATEFLAQREIIELEHAKKLLESGYYSHSILESFKALENHLLRKLTELDYRVSQHRFGEILAVSLKAGLLHKEEIPLIEDIRGMRNVSAHSIDVSLTKEQAHFALGIVQGILRRNVVSDSTSSERKG